jgi:hypothetical protein
MQKAAVDRHLRVTHGVGGIARLPAFRRALNQASRRDIDVRLFRHAYDRRRLDERMMFASAGSRPGRRVRGRYTATYQARPKLGANLTIYVRTDGNDRNSGLVNTAVGAVLTFAKAVAVAYAIDWDIYQVTVQFGAGSFVVTGILTGPFLSNKSLILLGDTGTPANVTLTTTSNGFQLQAGAAISLSGFTLSNSGFFGLRVLPGAFVSLGAGIVFSGSPTFAHVGALGGHVQTFSAFTVSASCNAVLWADAGGFIEGNGSGVTITLSGTPAWTTGFAIASYGGTVLLPGKTFSGSATGPRFSVSTNGAIFTNSAGLTYLPGNAAGTFATGGKYDSYADDGLVRTWGYATMSAGAPTLQSSFNMTSVTDEAAGLITFTIATDFASANWAPWAIPADTSTTIARSATISSQAAGSVQFTSVVEGGSGSDPTAWSFGGCGTQ